MNKKIFKIGDFCFQIEYSHEIHIPANFLLFQVNSGKAEYYYSILCCNELPIINHKVVAQRKDLKAMVSEGMETRYLGVKNIEGYYACYHEISNNQAIVTFLREQLINLHFDTFFTSLLALEKRQLQKDSLILHCSYIVYNDKAILFSGPSGIGKSTHSHLWKKHLNAEIVNGDRALLKKKDDKWCACGWPVSGSSEICYNKSSPIHAIVILSQGEKNKVERLSLIHSFTQLYSQITINHWNTNVQYKAIDILDTLISEVPIYHLSCTISKEAVFTLKEILDI